MARAGLKASLSSTDLSSVTLMPPDMVLVKRLHSYGESRRRLHAIFHVQFDLSTATHMHRTGTGGLLPPPWL
ncbi:hypothetical protein LTR04_003831 [Oleoguttula sp. CCFEE 6159]|nr:hypothetical protein LTR04_003831 [Oleoguttula sp. CCFEE 6159]